MQKMEEHTKRITEEQRKRQYVFTPTCQMIRLYLQCLGNSKHFLIGHRLLLHLQYKDEEVLQI